MLSLVCILYIWICCFVVSVYCLLHKIVESIVFQQNALYLYTHLLHCVFYTGIINLVGIYVCLCISLCCWFLCMLVCLCASFDVSWCFVVCWCICVSVWYVCWFVCVLVYLCIGMVCILIWLSFSGVFVVVFNVYVLDNLFACLIEYLLVPCWSPREWCANL